MREFSDYKDRMSIPQQAIAARLEKLWKSVEEARQAAYPSMTDEDLPKDYQQIYRALYFRIDRIMTDMMVNPAYIPDEETVLDEIRNRTYRFLEENDKRKT